MKAINEMEQALKKNRISLNETFNLPDYGYGENDNYNMDESEDEEVPMDNAPQVEENNGNKPSNTQWLKYFSNPASPINKNL